MNILLIKVILMPSVMAMVTLAIRKWGHQIGGLIGSMPWDSGAHSVVFILEQGKDFGIQSIPGVITGILALISFCYGYAAYPESCSGYLPSFCHTGPTPSRPSCFPIFRSAYQPGMAWWLGVSCWRCGSFPSPVVSQRKPGACPLTSPFVCWWPPCLCYW
jgi:hypothetical protein